MHRKILLICSVFSFEGLCFVPASADLGRDWTEAVSAAPWATRCDHSCADYAGKILVIGGTGAGYYGDIWGSTDGEHWVLTKSYPPPQRDWSPRYGHSTVVHNGKIWIIGGYSYGWPQNDVWFSSDAVYWTSATAHAAWSPRIEHTSLVYDGKMWVLGGYDRSLNPDRYKQDVWYSSDGVRWTSATLVAPCRLGNTHASVAYDGKIWVISNGVWNTTDGKTWTRVTATLPWFIGPSYWVSDQKAVVCDGKMWVMGGQDTITIGQSSVWYSTDGKNWTCATPYAPWPGRILFGLVVHNRKMWILGGYSPGLKGSQGILRNDVWYSSMPAAATPAWKLYP